MRWSHCRLRLFGSSLLSARNLFAVVVASVAFLELESYLQNLEGKTNASLERRTCDSCLEQSGNNIRLPFEKKDYPLLSHQLSFETD